MSVMKKQIISALAVFSFAMVSATSPVIAGQSPEKSAAPEKKVNYVDMSKDPGTETAGKSPKGTGAEPSQENAKKTIEAKKGGAADRLNSARETEPKVTVTAKTASRSSASENTQAAVAASGGGSAPFTGQQSGQIVQPEKTAIDAVAKPVADGSGALPEAKPAPFIPEQQNMTVAVLPWPDYVIGPEDVLEISVWKNMEMSKTVTVRPDGKISLPLIGDIQAAGTTPVQLRDSIVARLKEYQQTAIASVIVQAVNSYRIFILGEVKNPGTYQLKTSTTILQSISLAGGFTQFASKNKIVLVRKGPGLKEERHVIRFSDLVYGDEKTNQNLVLKAGDTIFVP